MTWLPTLWILVAFGAAWLAVWLAPIILAPLGLGEFTLLGQLCLVFLALTALEIAFSRLQHSS